MVSYQSFQVDRYRARPDGRPILQRTSLEPWASGRDTIINQGQTKPVQDSLNQCYYLE